MRINAGIDVKTLTDEHLLAEHREIHMLPYFVKKAKESGSINKVPSKFTLGEGHILFFTNKVGYVLKRYDRVHQECLRRGFNVKDYRKDLETVNDGNDYCVDYNDVQTIVSRIWDRITHSPKKTWHLHGEKISPYEAQTLIESNNWY